MKLSWCVFVVAITYAAFAHADEVGGARFTVPNGWTSTDQNGTRVVLPSSLASGEIMMGIVLGVQPLTGTPSAKIDELARTLNADAKVISSSKLETAPNGAVGTLYFKSFDVDAKDGGKHSRMLGILVRGKQCAVIVFVISNAAVLEKYAAGLQTLLTSLEVSGTSPTTTPTAPTPAPASASGPASTSSTIPTGSTPDKYPGSSGFRPSGTGVKVPTARVVDGRPQGLWWYPQARNGLTVAMRVIYLSDGTCATSPRPGGPLLFDLDQQRKLGGVGTFTVAKGTFSRTIDGFTQSGAFRSGSDKEGAYMKIGEMTHRPLAAVDTKLLVGTWTTAGNTYTFRADGTYASGNLTADSAIGKGGTWAVDGYTLFVRPSGEDGWVSTIGATTKNFVVIDSSVYERSR